MGKTVTEALIQNANDLAAAELKHIESSAVRHILVPDALIDTGATGLGLTGSQIRNLGIPKRKEREIKTAAGNTTVGVYGPVRLMIMGRDCPMDVFELPENCPVLIGQVPLELMDFIVDPRIQRLIPNPEHGGIHMWEAYLS